MDPFGRTDFELPARVRKTLHVIGPDAGRVDDDAHSHMSVLARLGVAQLGADDPAALASEADDLGGRAHGRAVRRCGAHQRQRVPRIIGLRVVVADTAYESTTFQRWCEG